MFRFLKQDEKNLCGEILYNHKRGLSYNSAYEKKEKVSFCLKIPTSAGVVLAKIKLYSEKGTHILDCDSLWICRRGNVEYYSFDIGNTLPSGLYFYELSVICEDRELFAISKENMLISFSSYERHKFQLSVSDFKYISPHKSYGGIIYQIFVDRFSKGKRAIKKDSGIYPEDFEFIPEYPKYPGAPLKNNTYFGGNLSGIAEMLPYFQELGVTLLYLTPIFESHSNHKYDTADYMRVDSGFGGDSALTELISKAKSYGIGIILDGVFNHTGADSIYFNKNGRYNSIGAYNSEDSEFYSWYEFQSYPDKYTCWWDIDILPRINPNAESFRDFISGIGGVIEKYTALGACGFRLDVVDELEDEFIQRIKYRQSKTNKNTFLYGEVWEDASNKIAYGKRKKYYLGKELDGVMNYPLRRGIISFIMHRGTKELKYALYEVYNNAPRRISDFQMNLLGSHDTARILTVLSDSFDENKSNDILSKERMSKEKREKAKMRLMCAYTILATLPGLPMIYYGDEAGLEGYSDPFNRLPYPHGKEDIQLLEFYQKIGKMRKEHKVYRRGDFKVLYIDEDSLLFGRYTKSFVYITAVNVGNSILRIKFDAKAENILDGREAMMYNLYENEAAVYRVRQSCNLDFKKELVSDTL